MKARANAEQKRDWCVATGERLAAARIAAGMTLAQVAVAAGVHLQTVYRWEAGTQPPDCYSLVRACAAIGVRVDTVLAAA